MQLENDASEQTLPLQLQNMGDLHTRARDEHAMLPGRLAEQGDAHVHSGDLHSMVPGQLAAQDIANREGATRADWLPTQLGQDYTGKDQIQRIAASGEDRMAKMFPGLMEHQNMENANLKSEADVRSGKGVNLNSVLALHQAMPTAFPEDFVSSYLKEHGGPEVRSSLEHTQNAAAQQKYLQYEDLAKKGGLTPEMHPQIMQEFGPDILEHFKQLGTQALPPQYQQYQKYAGDPAMQQLIAELNKQGVASSVDPGLVDARHALRSAAHPVSTGIADAFRTFFTGHINNAPPENPLSPEEQEYLKQLQEITKPQMSF